MLLRRCPSLSTHTQPEGTLPGCCRTHWSSGRMGRAGVYTDVGEWVVSFSSLRCPCYLGPKANCLCAESHQGTCEWFHQLKKQVPYCSFYSLLLITTCSKPNLFPLVSATHQTSWRVSMGASHGLCVWMRGVKMQVSWRLMVRIWSTWQGQHPS